MKKKIGIVNLEINNINSIHEACIEAGYNVKIIDKDTKRYNFDIIILPGIGSFKKGMEKLKKINFENKIKHFLTDRNNLLLGICLGMQLFFSKSMEFGNTKGLDLIKGEVNPINKKFIVPHTGWNKVKILKKKNYFKESYNKKNFYFTHSFYCKPKNWEYVIGETNYNNFKFCSMVKKENIIGTQFHPEKSSLDGISFLKNLEKIKI